MQWYVTKYCLSVQKHCEIFLMHRGLIMRVNALLHSCEWKKPIVASCINPRPHCQSLGEQDRPPPDTSVPLALLWLALPAYEETHYLLRLNRISYRLQWPTFQTSVWGPELQHYCENSSFEWEKQLCKANNEFLTYSELTDNELSGIRQTIFSFNYQKLQ